MQEGTFNGIDALARRLSLEIDCSIRLPTYGKRVFVCSHNIAFSINRLEDSNDWLWVKEHHDRGRK